MDLLLSSIKNLRAWIYSKNMRFFFQIHRLVFHPYIAYSASVSQSEYIDTPITRGHQDFPLCHFFFPGEVSDVNNINSYIKTSRWRPSQ